MAMPPEKGSDETTSEQAKRANENQNKRARSLNGPANPPGASRMGCLKNDDL
jgi:hypothetical protein